MSYSSAALDRWATWLDLETAYAATKFSAEEQQRYFREGVDRGNFSWSGSAVGYLKRATLLFDQREPRAVMRMVQNIGKAAHNHLMCAAVANWEFGISPTFMDSYFDLQDEWRQSLSQGVNEIRLHGSLASDQLNGFKELQLLQDEGDIDGFMRCVKSISLPIHAGFVALSEEVYLVQPGVSSTEDVMIWEARGDTDVARVISTQSS